ncbi:MAG: hypothetical protein ACI9EZ_000125 [Halobacteriales archaeon]
MQRSIVLGLSATFSGLTVLLVVAGLAARQPLVLVAALPFGIVAYVTYRQATGRLLTWTGPGPFGKRSRRRDRRARAGRGRMQNEGGGTPWTDRSKWAASDRRRDGFSGMSPSEREAYRRLDLDPGASQTAIRKAYRRKVKAVHPDADGGDPDEFKRVTEAYETLQER